MDIKEKEFSTELEKEALGKRMTSKFTVYLALFFGAILMMLPFYWMIVTSLKSRPEILTYPPTFMTANPTLESYEDLFRLVPMGRYVANSVIVAVSVTLTNLFFCSLAGYAFAKHKFWGREKIFLLLIGSMMIPWQVNLIPGFIIVKQLGWLNSFAGLIVPPMAGAFGVFLMRQFIREVPDALIEAAKIDGYGEFRIFWELILPLCKPALATLGIFTFMQQWNNFIWPLVIIHQSKMRTIPLALSVINSQFGNNFGMLMAGAAVSTIPMLIVFLIFQRQIIKGFTFSGLTG